MASSVYAWRSRKEANANTVEVSNAILAEIDRLRADYPQLEMVPVSNQGNFIERSIRNVAQSVLYGGALAVLVLFAFLRDVRSTAVIAISIPVSILATLAVVYLADFNVNLMTLGGLALGVGMMVDSSIVVLENIHRRFDELSETPSRAAVRGTREVSGAIIASTLTTLVIFLPVVFVAGVAGSLFREFAYVVVISLTSSLLVSLTVVPMLASRFHSGDRSTRSSDDSGIDPERQSAYMSLVSSAIAKPVTVLSLATLLLVLSVSLVPLIGSEFLPPSDEGEVDVTGEMGMGTRLDIVDGQTQIIERMIEERVSEAMARITSVGASSWRADSGARGSVRLQLSPATKRTRTNEDVAADLRKRLTGSVAGMEIRVRAPQGQNLLNRILPDGQGLTIEVRGNDLEIIETLAEQAAEVAESIPGVTDSESSVRLASPQEQLRIDRDKAADLGLSVRRVAEALETVISGRLAGEFRSQGDSIPIRVQLRGVRDMSLDEVLSLTLRTRSGEQVALRNLITSEPGRGPILIDRSQQQRIRTVTVNVGDRDEGSVAHDLEEALRTIPKPAGYTIEVAGSYAEQQEAFDELLLSVLLANALVYMVMASQYESLRDPFVVMFAVPTAAIGVLVMLFLTGTTLNVQSYIGCVMLGGIVVNNAILIVDQAEQNRRQGKTAKHAALTAARLRLRPILMTSTTTMLGLLPLALGIGEGADAQAPLARAVIGGLLSSMLATLIIVPTLYCLMHPETSQKLNQQAA